MDMQDRGLQPATMAIRFRAIRPFFRWLVDEDEIDRNPVEKTKTPSVPMNPPTVVPEADVTRLLAACKGPDFISRRDLAMLSLMLDTGLRCGELAGLRVGDLNLSQMVAFIEASTSESRRGRAVAFGAKPRRPSPATSATRRPPRRDAMRKAPSQEVYSACLFPNDPFGPGSPPMNDGHVNPTATPPPSRHAKPTPTAT